MQDIKHHVEVDKPHLCFQGYEVQYTVRNLNFISCGYCVILLFKTILCHLQYGTVC